MQKYLTHFHPNQLIPTDPLSIQKWASYLKTLHKIYLFEGYKRKLKVIYLLNFPLSLLPKRYWNSHRRLPLWLHISKHHICIVAAAPNID